MPILLNNDEVEALLTPGDCVTALEQAYLELGRQEAAFRARTDLYVHRDADGGFYRLRTMEGASAGLGVAAIRIGSDVVSWHQVDGRTEQRKVAAASGDRFVGLVLVFDVNTSEPLLIFPDGALQRMRVGATTTLAAKYMARPDARVLTVLGSGNQARGSVLSMAAVLPLQEVRIFSPRAERREQFAAQMARLTGLPVHAAASAAAAVQGADIVSCASNSLDPVLLGDWLEPGMHVGTIEWCELDNTALRRADRIAIHIAEDVRNQLAGVAAADVTGLHKHDMDDWQRRLPPLSAILSGEVPGRARADDITCFVNNVGCGLQFAAAGKRLYELASARGAGRALPLAWFTQDIPS